MIKNLAGDWHLFELAVDVHETPRLVGSMLFKLLDNADYTPDEVRDIASTLFEWAGGHVTGA